MSQVQLNFFGPLNVIIDGQLVTGFRTDKVRALLALLALEPTVPHSRQRLTALLWPEAPPTQAQANLRMTLSRLRQALQQVAATVDTQLLLATRQTLQFNQHVTEHEVVIDVVAFQMLIERVATHHQGAADLCAACLATLEQAVTLYGAEFLAGLDVADAPDFDAWLAGRRAFYTAQLLQCLLQLAQGYRAQGVYTLALKHLLRFLELDPYREEIQQQCLALYGHLGQVAQATAHFGRFRQLFEEELGLSPAAETVALVSQIQRGELLGAAPEARAQVHAPNIGNELPTVGAFFGREEEIARLQKLLFTDGSQIVAVLGMGGQGKTALAARVAELAADRYACVIWRSLLNAPPLAELLPTLLQTLADQQLGDLPGLLDAQLELLIGYLRKRRTLLILDNLESILDGAQPGRYLAGYEPYGQLLQQMALRNHQGQLLITSRERPPGFARLESDTVRVRALELAGLDIAAGCALITARGVTGTIRDQSELIRRFSGHPLALKLVAETVETIFFGELGDFLAAETVVFDDIRLMLDQQFARLSPLEQEILFWLAINREAMNLQQIRDDLLAPPPQRRLVEALRNLQRRSLLERVEESAVAGFGLQNVVIEYLTDRLIETAVEELLRGETQTLHHYAFLKTQAREYVQQSQKRLLLQPVSEQLARQLGQEGAQRQLRQQFDNLRRAGPRTFSYAGGNLLNLLIHLTGDGNELDAIDCSQLSIWQADLRNHTLTNINFAHADLARCAFTQTFSRIEAVAISPDGALLASAGDDGQIRIYRLADHQPVQTLVGHTNTVTTLAFHPNGGLLASGAHDGTIRLWEMRSGRALHVLSNGQSPVLVVAFSPDGTLLAGAGRDHKIRLWEAPTGALRQTLPGHSDTVHALAFHPDGKVLASGGVDGYLHLWEVGHLWAGEASQPAAIVADAAPQKPLRSLYAEKAIPIRAVAFSHDGQLLASGADDGVITLWDTDRADAVQRYQGHTGIVWSLAFAPDDRILYSGCTGHPAILLWDVANKEAVNQLAPLGTIWSLALTPDGKTLASGSEAGTVALWNVAQPTKATLLHTHYGYSKAPRAVDWSPDGRRLATGDIHGVVLLWDVSGANVPLPRRFKAGDEPITDVVFSPDGNLLATTGGVQGQYHAQLWELASGELKETMPVNSELTSLAFADGGRRLLGGSSDSMVYGWDRQASTEVSMRQIDQRKSHYAGITAALHTNLMVGYSDTYLYLLQIDTGEVVRQLPASGEIAFAALDARAAQLACAGPHHTIALWDLTEPARSAQPRLLVGHTNAVSAVRFSPDGRWLCSASLDRSVRIWDVATGAAVAVLGEHPQYVADVAVSPDGSRVASIGQEGTLRIWDVERRELVHILHAPGPYEGMNITGVAGITEAQRAALKALGAVEE
ncbi:MAG: BTAD domain-containing putative transcriptional regulator [Caldilineaceae bacterium]